jgi:hypothetical protein
VRVRIPFSDPELQAPDPREVAVAGGAIWIQRHGRGGRVGRFDLATREFTATVDIEYGVALQVADDGSLWAVGPWGYVPGPRAYTVSRINLTTGRVKPIGEVPVGDVSIGLDSIWVAPSAKLRQYDRAAGKLVRRWEVRSEQVDVACGAVWAWEWDGDLTRLDPATGVTNRYEGQGPVYETEDGCWRWVSNGIQRVWPEPVETTVLAVSPIAFMQFEGTTFWQRAAGVMRRWDPVTGEGVGTKWVLDDRDISPYWKLGDDGLVLSAGGSVWLVNGFEIVGFDIPATDQ